MVPVPKKKGKGPCVADDFKGISLLSSGAQGNVPDHSGEAEAAMGRLQPYCRGAGGI